jgi:hypothetical protein
VLTEDDVQTLRELLTRRDSWIEHYQKTELRTSSHIGALNERIRHLEKGAVHATINRIEGRIRRSPWRKLLGG